MSSWTGVEAFTIYFEDRADRTADIVGVGDEGKSGKYSDFWR